MDVSSETLADLLRPLSGRQLRRQVTRVSLTRGMVTREKRAEAADALPVLRIRPSKGWVSLRLDELWQYRELLYFLVWRDIKVRYKQTVLGAAWVILQPFLTMVVFTLFFGKLAKVPSDGIPYPLFSFTGLVPWTLFAYSLTESSGSLVTNQNLITKVYFPRLIIPLASVLAGLVDFAISFSVLLLLMFYYGVVPHMSALTVPLFVILAVLAA